MKKFRLVCDRFLLFLFCFVCLPNLTLNQQFFISCSLTILIEYFSSPFETLINKTKLCDVFGGQVFSESVFCAGMVFCVKKAFNKCVAIWFNAQVVG